MDYSVKTLAQFIAENKNSIHLKSFAFNVAGLNETAPFIEFFDMIKRDPADFINQARAIWKSNAGLYTAVNALCRALTIEVSSLVHRDFLWKLDEIKAKIRLDKESTKESTKESKIGPFASKHDSDWTILDLVEDFVIPSQDDDDDEDEEVQESSSEVRGCSKFLI